MSQTDDVLGIGSVECTCTCNCEQRICVILQRQELEDRASLRSTLEDNVGLRPSRPSRLSVSATSVSPLPSRILIAENRENCSEL